MVSQLGSTIASNIHRCGFKSCLCCTCMWSMHDLNSSGPLLQYKDRQWDDLVSLSCLWRALAFRTGCTTALCPLHLWERLLVWCYHVQDKKFKDGWMDRYKCKSGHISEFNPKLYISLEPHLSHANVWFGVENTDILYMFIWFWGDIDQITNHCFHIFIWIMN